MLTCVNPDISFRMKTCSVNIKYKGVGVALKWFLSMIAKSGTTPPTEDRIKQEIRALEIGETGDKKQYFNKFPNGRKITRGEGGVEIQSKSCVIVKQAAFGTESWKIFSEGNFYKKMTRRLVQPNEILSYGK
jgi:hypothetical protein